MMNINEFRAVIDGYFADCERSDTFPDLAGQLLRLKISRERYDKYLRLGGGVFKRALEDAELRRESILTREIYASGKSTTGKIFLARRQAAGSEPEARRDAQEPSLVFEVKLDGDPELAE
jgi:hypothetical protein